MALALRDQVAEGERERRHELVCLKAEASLRLKSAEESVARATSAATAREERLPLGMAPVGPGGPHPLQLCLAQARDALAELRGVRRRLDALREEGEGERRPALAKLVGGEGQMSDAGSEGSLRQLAAALDEAYSRLHKELQRAQRSGHSQGQSNSREQQLLAQRAELLGEEARGSSAGSQLQRRRQLRTEGDRAAAAADVTQSLRRTQHVMVQEVQRGLGTMEVLDDSAATLARSDSLYRQQKGKLGTAHSRLSRLFKMNQQERIVLVLGMTVFLAVCSRIIYRRSPLLQHVVATLLSIVSGATQNPYSPTSPLDPLTSQPSDMQAMTCPAGGDCPAMF